VCPQRLEVRAARQEGDIRACGRQPTTEITTDAAAPDDCDAHGRGSYHAD
jgi:hypothetical protein